MPICPGDRVIGLVIHKRHRDAVEIVLGSVHKIIVHDLIVLDDIPRNLAELDHCDTRPGAAQRGKEIHHARFDLILKSLDRSGFIQNEGDGDLRALGVEVRVVVRAGVLAFWQGRGRRTIIAIRYIVNVDREAPDRAIPRIPKSIQWPYAPVIRLARGQRPGSVTGHIADVGPVDDVGRRVVSPEKELISRGARICLPL